MRNIKLVIEYDGTNFYGWQAQPGLRTVQGALEQAIRELTGEAARPAGAGRTDAGVHAEGQVASFRTASMLPAAKFAPALTALLPEDVAVLRAEDVPEEFHARHSAQARIYRYHVLAARMRRPTTRRRAWHVRVPLDIAAMRRAAAPLVGEHDFRSFGAGLEPDEPTVRRLERIDIAWRNALAAGGADRADRWTDGAELVLTFRASSFLRRMVRMLVGSLLEVGRGRWIPGRVEQVLAARDNLRCASAVPAHGLTLQEVIYGDAG